MSYEELRASFEQAGQAHVFQFWNELNESERAQLLDDCARVDFAWVEQRLRQFRRESSATMPALDIRPAPVIRLPSADAERAAEAEARRAGEEALRGGKLAAFLVAGGQGTRLGFEGPKGCYRIGPISDRTLFRWHAEQIRARARRYGAKIPWYVMTSRANHADTVAYFEQNDYLGFDRTDVMLFQQGMVPSLDKDGKLILAEKHALAMNPDGHGGSLTALARSGAVADMKKRGVEYVSYFQVDNPLVTICDPVFAGYHILARAEMSSKILDKSGPEEKVGHICINNGKLTVIEYSDMDFVNMHARDTSGRLVFWAGSIAIHMLSVGFVERVGGKAELPWHVARKKIPFVGENGRKKTPDSPNGVKFETFVFDALPLASGSVTMEVAREDEFAPVKNASGVDSAESCRELLSGRFRRWLDACGMEPPAAPAALEISPLYALDAQELGAKLPRGSKIAAGTLLE